MKNGKTSFKAGLKTIDPKSKVQNLGTDANRTLHLMLGI